MPKSALTTRLERLARREQLVGHEFFRNARHAPLTHAGVAVILGQWWHPLHFFPRFLARAVSVLPDIASQCAITKILYQETGEGDPQRAHEVIYVDTMASAGFTPEETTMAAPFAETEALVAGYARAAENRFTALGFIFATEVADLAMVSGIGAAVARVAGTRDLPWVRIHVDQEPDHVKEADHTMHSFAAGEEALVVDSAEEMWQLWLAFFDRLQAEAFAAPLEPNGVRSAVSV